MSFGLIDKLTIYYSDIMPPRMEPHLRGFYFWEYQLSVHNEKFVNVDFPNTHSTRIYSRLNRIKDSFNKSTLFQKIQPIAGQIISVAEPTGRVSILDEPEVVRERRTENQVAIMTANLWHDWPRQRMLKERLGCFVQLVLHEGIDILLLQEVTRTKDFRMDEWLAEKLGMAYVYSRANGHEGGIGFEEGLAVFSRFPIEEPRIAQLSLHKNPFFRRIALGAKIKIEDQELLAYSVHLGIKGNQNELQLSRLIKWVEGQSDGLPTVIGGDFNASEKTSQIRDAQDFWFDSFRELNPDKDGFTHKILWPWGGILSRSRLDYLFLNRGKPGWKVGEARQVEIDGCPVSDHTPVLLKAFLPGK